MRWFFEQFKTSKSYSEINRPLCCGVGDFFLPVVKLIQGLSEKEKKIGLVVSPPKQSLVPLSILFFHALMAIFCS